MFSLQELFSPKDKFFDLLEASAEEARASVKALIHLIENPRHVSSLEEFSASRRKEKQIASEISDAVCTTFVTALEREDIEALSQALYKIPKTVEKIGERIVLAPHLLAGVDLSRHAAMLDGATLSVTTMVTAMRKGWDLDEMRAHNAKLQAIEGEADRMMFDLLKQLYESKSEPLQALFLKDLFELLEKVIDRCRDAGNVINQIVLKNT
ncbi:MAG: DUF47 family protein [Verrucomicrobiota bacterium]